MKTYRLTTLAFALSLAALPLSAAEPVNLVANGDFETGKALFFNSTPPWYNRGTGLKQNANARTDKNVLTGGQYCAVVNDRYDTAKGAFGPVAHSQATKHILQAGETFNLSYDWHPVDIHWQKGRDTIRFVLYATANDKLGGEVVWSSVLNSDFYAGGGDKVKSVLQRSDPVTPAAAGKKLFLIFHGIDTVDGVEGSTHFARVDNIVLTAEPAPPKR